MPSLPPPSRRPPRRLDSTRHSSLPWRRGAVETARQSTLELFPRGSLGPTFIESSWVVPADSLREGARLWGRFFREAGLGPGDRVVLSARPGAGFLHVLAAALRGRLTLVLVPEGSDLEVMLDRFDARAAVGESARAASWVVGRAGEPPDGRPIPRRALGPPTPSARLILATSGTTGTSRWVALSDRNLQSVLSCHRPRLGLEGGRVLSVLPWTHAFGLIMDLLPSLVSGATVVRDPAGGRDPGSMADLLRRHEISHLSAVPLIYRRLVEHCGNDLLLRGLRGGVVGGSPITPSISSMLAATRLRVGYGLTEASPGIALGSPGVWAPYSLGRPLGCEVGLGPAGGLQFRGPNACLGLWSERRLHCLDPGRWVETGDLVEIRGGELIYRGRVDDRFKLENGRWIHAGLCAESLCRQFPGLDEAVLFTPDGHHLALAWSSDPAKSQPGTASLREALGSSGAVLRWIVRIPEREWSRTGKGAIDRRATEGRLKDLIRASEECYSC